ncbi:MAG: hypothetical protein A2288_01950 [Candidatus Moranbacteria bacterium RIFOXYA12_FULL_44_15]|nr:MAG: hypothetical protein A2288_01950 [Candidatus Moranbacteria bacterium RIFOXYA12_FULL_44_15]OGI35459.1 MAG: hypothetical protein A2259_02425 [Candidatus Moranbacteria bacterium RIFOXYA2_FULL_43_15]
MQVAEELKFSRNYCLRTQKFSKNFHWQPLIEGNFWQEFLGFEFNFEKSSVLQWFIILDKIIPYFL